MLSIADAVRVFCAAAAIALIPCCVYSMFRDIPRDQRLRFFALICIGVVVAAGQIDALGGPWHWRMPILAVGMVLAVAGTAMFLRRDRAERDRKDG